MYPHPDEETVHVCQPCPREACASPELIHRGLVLPVFLTFFKWTHSMYILCLAASDEIYACESWPCCYM